MRNILIKSLAGGAVLLLSVAASAQDYGRYPDGRYNDDGGRRYAERRGYRGDVIDQVRGDLSYARGAVYSRGEARRLDKAAEELGEFQRRWASGRFDRHELDDSIAAIQHVVDHGGLDGRARDVLWNDLARLRDFRASAEGRGYYQPRY